MKSRIKFCVTKYVKISQIKGLNTQNFPVKAEVEYLQMRVLIFQSSNTVFGFWKQNYGWESQNLYPSDVIKWSYHAYDSEWFDYSTWKYNRNFILISFETFKLDYWSKCQELGKKFYLLSI